MNWDRGLKRITLVLATVALSGCASYPVVGCFNEYNEVFTGKVRGNLLTGTSKITVEGINTGLCGEGGSWITYIPPVGTCKGQKGEAVLTFNDGRIVKALFTCLSCTSGVGAGADQYGNTFTFKFGLKKKEAEQYIRETKERLKDRPDLPAAPVSEPKKERGLPEAHKAII